MEDAEVCDLILEINEDGCNYVSAMWHADDGGEGVTFMDHEQYVTEFSKSTAIQLARAILKHYGATK